jgi:phage terminase large subunit-like protein
MGVVVVARTSDDHWWVLADETVSLAGRDAALHAWRVLLKWNATKLVYEDNLGKKWMKQVFFDAYNEMVKSGEMPADTRPPMMGVAAKLGKKTRAEPVALRSQQLRLHMVGPADRFTKLESQLTEFTSWDGKESPDRLDALVHACRQHMKDERNKSRIVDPRDKVREERFDEGLGLGYDFRNW